MIDALFNDGESLGLMDVFPIIITAYIMSSDQQANLIEFRSMDYDSAERDPLNQGFCLHAAFGSHNGVIHIII